MQNLKGFASQILIAGATVKSVPHLRQITDVITDIKSGGRYEKMYKRVLFL